MCEFFMATETTTITIENILGKCTNCEHRHDQLYTEDNQIIALFCYDALYCDWVK